MSAPDLSVLLDPTAHPFTQYAAIASFTETTGKRFRVNDEEESISILRSIHTAWLHFYKIAPQLLAVDHYPLLVNDLNQLSDSFRDYWPNGSAKDRLKELLKEGFGEEGELEKVESAISDADMVSWCLDCLEVLGRQLQKYGPSFAVYYSDCRSVVFFYLCRTYIDNIKNASNFSEDAPSIVSADRIRALYGMWSPFSPYISQLTDALTSLVASADYSILQDIREKGLEPESYKSDEAQNVIEPEVLRSTGGKALSKVAPTLLEIWAMSEDPVKAALAVKRLDCLSDVADNPTALAAFQKFAPVIAERQDFAFFLNKFARMFRSCGYKISWDGDSYTKDPDFATWHIKTLTILGSHLSTPYRAEFLAHHNVDDEIRSQVDRVKSWYFDSNITKVSQAHNDMFFALGCSWMPALTEKKWMSVCLELGHLCRKLQRASPELITRHPHPAITQVAVISAYVLDGTLQLHNMDYMEDPELLLAVAPAFESLIIDRKQYDIIEKVMGSPAAMKALLPAAYRVSRECVESGSGVPTEFVTVLSYANFAYNVDPDSFIANLDWIVKLSPPWHYPLQEIAGPYHDGAGVLPGSHPPRPEVLNDYVLEFFENAIKGDATSSMQWVQIATGYIKHERCRSHFLQNHLEAFLSNILFKDTERQLCSGANSTLWSTIMQDKDCSKLFRPYWKAMLDHLSMIATQQVGPVSILHLILKEMAGEGEMLYEMIGDEGLQKVLDAVFALLDRKPEEMIYLVLPIFGVVGCQSKEAGTKCADILVEIMEKIVPTMAGKMMASSNVLLTLTTLKSIAEETDPSVIRPVKDRLTAVLQYPTIESTHQDLGKAILDIEAGVSMKQMWAALGLDKTDPFLSAANEALTRVTSSTNMYDAMISYTVSQRPIALRIRDALRKRGLKVCIDLDVAVAGGGDSDLYSKMAELVIKSMVVLPVISKKYEADPDRKKELGFAADQTREGKKIVPVRLEDGPFSWSALITAGLLYTYLGRAELDDDAKFDKSMDGLTKEIQSGIVEYKQRHNIPIDPPAPVESVVQAAAVAAESEPVVEGTSVVVQEPKLVAPVKEPVVEVDEEMEEEMHAHGRDVGVEAPVAVEEKYDVMLSYNWGHQTTVLKMRDSLLERGFSVWMDVDLMSGNVYQKMAEAVLGSKVIVSCLTGAYEKSGNCRRELGFAWDQVLDTKRAMARMSEQAQTAELGRKHAKAIIPVYLEDAASFTWSKLITQGLQSVQINAEDVENRTTWDARMDQLSVLIKACLLGESIALPGYEDHNESESVSTAIVPQQPIEEPVEDRIRTLEIQIERLISLQQRNVAATASSTSSPVSSSYVVVDNSAASSAQHAETTERLSSLEARMGRLEEKLIHFQVAFDEFVGNFEETMNSARAQAYHQQQQQQHQQQLSGNGSRASTPLTPPVQPGDLNIQTSGDRRGSESQTSAGLSLRSFTSMFAGLGNGGVRG